MDEGTKDTGTNTVRAATAGTPAAGLAAPALVATWLIASLDPAAAQSGQAKGKTGGKSIDQLRQDCYAEYPQGTYRDRSTLVSRCIQRKKEEAGQK